LLEDGEQLKKVEVDLPSQRVIREDGSFFEFEVDPFRKHCLLNGLDDIGLTMQKMDEIRAFEVTGSNESV
jgi:3-isopropylmalate dehydratase small subunit